MPDDDDSYSPGSGLNPNRFRLERRERAALNPSEGERKLGEINKIIRSNDESATRAKGIGDTDFFNTWKQVGRGLREERRDVQRGVNVGRMVSRQFGRR